MSNISQLAGAQRVVGITDSFYPNLHEAVSSVWVAIGAVAILTNAINVKTFMTLGVNDGVSASFLGLALSDLFYSFFVLLTCLFMLLARLEVSLGILLPVNPVAPIVYFYIASLAIYPVSGMSTAYMAFTRCMCVVKPLQFKNSFTKSRSIIIHVFFALFSIGSYAAIYTQMFITQAYDPPMNVTRHMLMFTKMRDEVKDVVFFMFDNVVAFATQIVMIACVIIIAGSLKKFQQFRQASQVAKSDENSKSTNKLTGKDLMVVKQVVLICVVYTLCSLPKMTVAVLSFAEPDFAVGRRLSDLYFLSHLTRSGFEMVNAATTILIYTVFNSKFRAHLCHCGNLRNVKSNVS